VTSNTAPSIHSKDVLDDRFYQFVSLMHMKENHMRNAQLKPGYNIQIRVEGGYVIGTDIFSERSVQLAFIPFLDRREETRKFNFSQPQGVFGVL